MLVDPRSDIGTSGLRRLDAAVWDILLARPAAARPAPALLCDDLRLSRPFTLEESVDGWEHHVRSVGGCALPRPGDEKQAGVGQRPRPRTLHLDARDVQCAVDHEQ